MPMLMGIPNALLWAYSSNRTRSINIFSYSFLIYIQNPGLTF